MQLVFIFVYFCPLYASYFSMSYVDIKKYDIDVQYDNLYMLWTCNAAYSYILISHININMLHVGINKLHVINKMHIYKKYVKC